MKRFKSINWYLQSWHIMAMMIMAPIFLSIYYHAKKGSILHRVDMNLSREATRLVSQYDAGLYEKPTENRASLVLLKSPRWSCLWDKTGKLIDRSANAPSVEPPESMTDLDEILWSGEARVYYHYSQKHQVLWAVGVPKGPIQTRINRSFYMIFGTLFVIAPLVIFGAHLTTKKGLEPINEITVTAREIRNGHFHKRIDPDGVKVELVELTSILNEAFERIENTLSIQQQFTSNASHELRTPISILVLELEALADKSRSREMLYESIDNCIIAVKRLERLTTSMLHVSRLESGEVELELRPQRIDRVITETMQALGPLLETKSINLEQSLESLTVPLCAEQFSLVINNLISNSVAHMAENGSLEISCEEKNQLALITVRDDGEGISSEHLPYIFDRLYRADTARSAESARSGLGLSISQGIVLAHGGKIAVESAVGVGTTFTISLPLSVC